MSSPLVRQAHSHLRQAGTPFGYLASLEAVDNYRRIWARDGVIAGIAGLLAQMPEAPAALLATLNTLAAGQGQAGQIPSNVQLDALGQPAGASYGGLAGRVDASSWFVVGAALLGLHHNPPGFREAMREPVSRALAVMEAWEFNQRHLMYTPVSGNWADEYPVHGYLLYDQLVRLWGTALAARYWEMPAWAEKAQHIHDAINLNFWMVDRNVDVEVRHPVALQAATPVAYAACGFSPSGYDTRFDLAANALALLLGIGTDNQRATCIQWLKDTARQRGHWLFSAFWPVIHPGSEDWAALSQNHAYRFKNMPHHFHNGGIWPVWLGWLGIGLAVAGEQQATETLAQNLAQAISPDDNLPEYLAGDTLLPGGARPLSYTASGILLLSEALTQPAAALKQFFTPFAL